MKQNEPFRVLHIVGGMYPGGMENYIMNLYRNIDRTRVQFDFIIHIRKENDYVDQIKEMGGNVYLLPRLTRHPIKNLRQIKRIVKENGISVVIRHTANALITPQLLAAKCGGAKTICHSHSTTDPQLTLHKLGRLFMKAATDERWACSDDAGKWMFGKLDYRVINNAIDLNEFGYDTGRREKIRNELIPNNTDARVYGHVGNFSEVKNHSYLLKVFKEIADIQKNSFLFVIGEGELRPQIEAQIASLGLEGRVILTGIRADVSSIMSAMDVMIFPSIYEGIPLTLIEAQANGLQCVISDVITDKVIVTEGIISKLSINEAPDTWARLAISKAEETRDNAGIHNSIREHGYDLKALAEWFENYIVSM